MESIILEFLKASPYLGLAVFLFIYQRKDYQQLITQVQADSKEREIKLHSIIDKLTKKFDVVDELRDDIKEIKGFIEK